MGAFSGRPLIVLELFFTSSFNNRDANQSQLFWQLQARETASQPSFAPDPTSTATVSFSLEPGVTLASGSLNPSIPNWGYDFSASGLQTKVIATGTFVVNHNSTGYGGLINGSATANASGNIGNATASVVGGLPDFDYTPTWQFISTPSPAIRGVAYSGQFFADYTGSYSVIAGTVPNGLTLNSNGTLTGTPTTLGSFTFIVQANGSVENTSTAERTIVVNPPAPVFSDQTIQAIAIRGVAYSDGVSASDTASYSIASSSLPTGMSFNTSTGAITGTPTTLQSRNPVFRATNVTGSTDTPALSITVNPPAPVFSDSTVLGSASIGSFYSDAVVASDVASYSVFSGTLPDGITLNTSTGVISGTPTTAGNFTFVIRATNVTGSTNTPSRSINVISPVRVWNGSGFAIGSLRVWNGTDFVNSAIRVWNGTTWVSAK